MTTRKAQQRRERLTLVVAVVAALEITVGVALIVFHTNPLQNQNHQDFASLQSRFDKANRHNLKLLCEGSNAGRKQSNARVPLLQTLGRAAFVEAVIIQQFGIDTHGITLDPQKIRQEITEIRGVKLTDCKNFAKTGNGDGIVHPKIPHLSARFDPLTVPMPTTTSSSPPASTPSTTASPQSNGSDGAGGSSQNGGGSPTGEGPSQPTTPGGHSGTTGPHPPVPPKPPPTHSCGVHVLDVCIPPLPIGGEHG